MRVSEHRQGASQAKQAMMRCDLCGKMAFVTFPFGATPPQRNAVMKAALDEHRVVCTAAPAEARRVYEILYPRA